MIVSLNSMSFLKASKLENYTQIFSWFHFNFTKRPEVNTVYNKGEITYDMRKENMSIKKIEQPLPNI